MCGIIIQLNFQQEHTSPSLHLSRCQWLWSADREQINVYITTLTAFLISLGAFRLIGRIASLQQPDLVSEACVPIILLMSLLLNPRMVDSISRPSEGNSRIAVGGPDVLTLRSISVLAAGAAGVKRPRCVYELYIFICQICT